MLQLQGMHASPPLLLLWERALPRREWWEGQAVGERSGAA